MRRVVVTGGSGHTGKVVVADLLAVGCEVLNVDVLGDGGAPHRSVDLLDYRATFEAFDGTTRSPISPPTRFPTPTVRPGQRVSPTT